MARYSTGENTRNIIYTTCKRLFYENGFDATSHSMILEESGVNPGTFSYHFKSRENVAGLINAEMVEATHGWVDRNLQTLPDLDRSVLAQAVLRWLMYNDEKLYRFFSEISSRSIRQSELDVYRRTYSGGYRLFREKIGDEKAEVFFTASSGMASTLEPYLYERRDTISFEKCVYYSVDAYMMHIVMPEELTKTVERALGTLSELRITNSGFDVYMEKI